MDQIPKQSKIYNLEDRTFKFAQDIRLWIKQLRLSNFNQDDIRQLLRSSGSVGANYIEANESLGKKDFLMRIRICRKEAKESEYWLRLLETGPSPKVQGFIQEAVELRKIFGAILEKSKS